MFVSQILLAPHCDCTYVCLRACIHVIWCNYCYCISMVLCCLAWYGFLWPVLASCDDHSQVSYAATCQSLSIYFHAWPCFIISSSHPDEPESQPLRSLQERDILQLPLHRLVLGPAVLNIHPLDGQTQINNSHSFSAKSHYHELRNRPSIPPQIPISQFQIFIAQHLWHSGRRLRGPKSRWSGWTLPERRSSSGSKRSERSSGNSMEIWMFLDLYNWDMVRYGFKLTSTHYEITLCGS